MNILSPSVFCSPDIMHVCSLLAVLLTVMWWLLFLFLNKEINFTSGTYSCRLKVFTAFHCNCMLTSEHCDQSVLVIQLFNQYVVGYGLRVKDNSRLWHKVQLSKKTAIYAVAFRYLLFRSVLPSHLSTVLWINNSTIWHRLVQTTNLVHLNFDVALKKIECQGFRMFSLLYELSLVWYK
jgi:hypothetical protein